MTTVPVAERRVSPFLARRGVATADAATREGPIDGLLGVFLDEGFRHPSGDDMAGRLRCAKSTLHLIASSKERIIVAVDRGFFRRATERVERHVELAPASTAHSAT